MTGLREQSKRRRENSYVQTATEALENPSDPRDNGAVITGQDWIDGWQAALSDVNQVDR